MKDAPRPGDIGFSKVPGKLGFFLGLLLFLQGGGSRFCHTFIVLDDNTVLEAKPKGARISPLENFKGRSIFIDWGLTDDQRAIVVAEARKYVGVRYSIVDYLALGFAKFNKYPVKLYKYLTKSNKFICSNLVHVVYNNAGVQIFSDGRNSYSVTPGDLLFRFHERDWMP